MSLGKSSLSKQGSRMSGDPSGSCGTSRLYHSVSVSTRFTPNPNQSTHQASDSGSVTREDDLLALRKDHHHNQNAISKATHHLGFLNECRSSGVMPKGLQIQNTPQAFLNKMTNINTEWKNIVKQAEQSLLDTLINDYGEVLTALEEKREILQISMQRATRNKSPEIQQHHREIMKKTTDNIKKREETLKEKSQNKLKQLRNPQPRNNRERPEPQRRPHQSQQRQPRRNNPPATYAAAAATNPGFQQGGSGPSHPRAQPRRPTSTQQRPAPQRKTPLPTPPTTSTAPQPS